MESRARRTASARWAVVLLAGACAGEPASRQGGDAAEVLRLDAREADAPRTATPPGPCGTGSWRPGTLELHHLAIGQADATLIVGPTGRTLLVDAGEPRWDGDSGARAIGAYVRAVTGCQRLDYVLVSHFHADHIGYVERGGLWHLVVIQGFLVGKMLHRDVESYVGDSSGTLGRWRDYLRSDAARARLNPEVVREGAEQVNLGADVTFTVVATDGNGALARGDFSADRAPPNENDYSVAAVLRFGRFDYFTGGDLSGELAESKHGYAYHDIEVGVAREVGDIDVYRVNHHGSDHSSNPVFVAQLDPEVSIISAGAGNAFGHPRPAVVDRLLRRGALYLTERGDRQTDLGPAKVAGHVVVRTGDGETYTVGADRFVATDPQRIDADGDGYFREADPDDARAGSPAAHGGCDVRYQSCP